MTVDNIREELFACPTLDEALTLMLSLGEQGATVPTVVNLLGEWKREMIRRHGRQVFDAAINAPTEGA